MASVRKAVIELRRIEPTLDRLVIFIEPVEPYVPITLGPLDKQYIHHGSYLPRIEIVSRNISIDYLDEILSKEDFQEPKYVDTTSMHLTVVVILISVSIAVILILILRGIIPSKMMKPISISRLHNLKDAVGTT